MSPQPRLDALFFAWCKVGIQSFGGGAATLALIRREFVDRRGWLTEAQFTRDWSLCQLAPGINLVSFTYLIGKRVGGKLAILCSLLGLLIPSFLLTLLVTYYYVQIHASPQVKAALKCLVPAIAGIGLATAFQMGRPILKQGLLESHAALWFWVAILVVAALVFAFLHLPVIAVLLGAGVLGAIRGILIRKQKEESP